MAQPATHDETKMAANGTCSTTSQYGAVAGTDEGATTPVVNLECETDELIDKASERDLSNFRAFAHLFRVMTGPSFLGTGKIMENGGVLLGPLGFVFIGYLNAWCNITIVNCSRILCKRLGRHSLKYDDIVEESFLLYSHRPGCLKAARVFRKLSETALVLCQLGLLSFYIKVIGSTIHEEILSYSPSYPLALVLTELIVCALLIPYSFMRNLNILSWFSLLGNIIIMVAVVTILQYMCLHQLNPATLPLVTDDVWTLPLFVGATVFTVEGIPMIIPLENRVKRPQDYGGLCGLVMLAATLNICLNLAVGYLSYLSVGTKITGNVLVHLPATWVYSSVSIAVAVMVFLTYAIQLYMPAELLSAFLKTHVKTDFIQRFGGVLTRTLIVITSYLITAVVPKMDLLMSLIGAFTSIVLVFGFPPLAELLVVYKDSGYLPWNVLLKDVSLLVFGVIFFVTGTYTSLVGIAEAL